MVYNDYIEEDQSKYLDYIEFSFAELVTDSKSSSNVIKRCWSPNKIVDLNVLCDFKVKINEIFKKYQTELVLHKIESINYYTSHLPISLIFENLQISSYKYISHLVSGSKINYQLLNEKKSLIVEVDTLHDLVEKKIINWSPTLVSLYPIQTFGDGNCLVNILISSSCFICS